MGQAPRLRSRSEGEDPPKGRRRVEAKGAEQSQSKSAALSRDEQGAWRQICREAKQTSGQKRKDLA